MARPEILFPLFANAITLPGIGPKSAQALERLGIGKVVDLLFHIPHGLIDRRQRDSLVGIDPGEVVTVAVIIGQHRRGRSETQPYRVVVEGGGLLFEVVYFRAKADWIERLLPQGERRVISGKVEFFDGRLQMTHPELVLTEADAKTMAPFEPVYPLTQGLAQRQLRKAVTGALGKAPDMPEWLRKDMLEQKAWPSWTDALRQIHEPQGAQTLAPGAPARARLAYDELLSHQLALMLARASMQRGKGQGNAGDGELRKRAATAFGFPPTGAQAKALEQIEADMRSALRMLRLLQGDVGSGKTWVALMALLIAVEAGGQGALMAPTEILARQHAKGLEPLAEAAGVAITLLTGRDKGAARREKLAAIAEGGTGIVIGTHALFQSSVAFHDLRLAVIDEQHRFGVRQRMELTAKAPAGCDVLVMTATPIPRTLALAGYGDLDISVLDEKPPGRQPIETRLISTERYLDVVERLGQAIARGDRAYWVCPLVEESDRSAMIAAEDRFRDLQTRFGAAAALVHGQMPPDEKDAAMARFQSGEAQILVATTVIEVGVDVPEATIMVIEQAEMFGLAQLHQLRGRVGRGAGRSSCLLMFSPPLGATARARLEMMRETEDGFRIAEEDLRLRGAGDVLGTAQSGLPRFKIADLERDTGLMEAARDDARLVMHSDPTLRGERGKALKTLLYLMDRDASIQLLKIG
ncbi:MAG: ATP-dependent DNA helicase RecG [Pseudomonadota bacterium]